MNSRIRTKLLPFAIASLLAASVPAMAQDTSSSISGRVLDANGQPVAGATVQIVHEPSGTTKITTTGPDGRYSSQGLRVGGPFDVTVSKAGMAQAEQDNVYLQLAQETPVNLTMGGASEQAATNLSGVTVSANSLAQTFSADNKGISTNVSSREIEATPTPDRSIQNIVRLDPRIVVTDRAAGSFSAIGQNSRYNNITVDSVSANDPFGLNANGLPTLGTPISQDTIEEYNISTANYDVATRRGLGAAVNAVTKSGTNDFTVRSTTRSRTRTSSARMKTTSSTRASIASGPAAPRSAARSSRTSCSSSHRWKRARRSARAAPTVPRIPAPAARSTG